MNSNVACYLSSCANNKGVYVECGNVKFSVYRNSMSRKYPICRYAMNPTIQGELVGATNFRNLLLCCISLGDFSTEENWFPYLTDFICETCIKYL